MDLLTDLAGGSGVLGTLFGALGGIVSGFLKLKTLRETNQHAHAMAKLAGDQEVERARAELEVKRVDGEIRVDLAAEESLQGSLEHDAALGSWLRGRELGAFGTAVLCTAEFVRMMMRPVLTLWAFVYVVRLTAQHAETARAEGLAGVALLAQVDLLTSTVVMLATVSFTWWFADRSVSKALGKRLAG